MSIIYPSVLMCPGPLSSTNQRSSSLKSGICSISRIIKVSSEKEQKAGEPLKLEVRVHSQGYSHVLP